MGWLLDILGSAGLGSIIGGVFGYLTKREERANLQMKLDHDLNMIQAKTSASVQVAKMGIQEATNAGQLLVQRIEAQAFMESQKSTSKISEIIKSLIRPVILGLLMYQTFKILIALEQLTGGITGLSADDIVGLYRVVILSVTGLTATAVGWYFAARSSKQFDKLLERL